MRQLFSVIFAGFFAVLFALPSTYAQNSQEDTQPQAAILRVTFAGVMFRRANTQAWIPLRAGAEMPIGAGDQVQTGEQGRVILTFGVDDAQALVMPLSQVTFNEFTVGDEISVNLTVDNGRAIFAVDSRVNFAEFHVHAGDAVVTEPSPNFAVQVDTIIDVVNLVSAEGDLGVLVDGDMIAVPAEHGLRVRDGVLADAVTLLGFPYSFAKLDGILDGCPARINTRGEISLNVRVGPNIEYDTLGSVPHNTPVYLMAVSPNNERYRIQFFSGFGWILATGVDTTCADLPVMPYRSPETVLRVERAQAAELEFLYPFFGDPRQNVIFYILPEL